MKKLLIFSLILITFACKDDDVTSPQPPLVNTKWALTQVQSNETNQIIGYPPEVQQHWGDETVFFTDSANVAELKGLCNTGGAEYSVSESTGRIDIHEVITSKMLCEYHEWEEYFLNNLDSATAYYVSGDKLTIRSSGQFDLFFTRIGK